MLTGRSLFAADNASQTLARVLEWQPDFSTLPPNLHSKITEILERCLEKNPKNRCHDIADSRTDIQKVLADPNGVFSRPVPAPPPEPLQIIRPDHVLPEGQELGDLFRPILAVSPDCTQFVYSTSKGLYLRRVDQLEATLIDGADANPASPFFSHDGQWIAYFSAFKLKKSLLVEECQWLYVMALLFLRVQVGVRMT
jgi:serine/threonine protein kinase